METASAPKALVQHQENPSIYKKFREFFGKNTKWLKRTSFQQSRFHLFHKNLEILGFCAYFQE